MKKYFCVNCKIEFLLLEAFIEHVERVHDDGRKNEDHNWLK